MQAYWNTSILRKWFYIIIALVWASGSNVFGATITAASPSAAAVQAAINSVVEGDTVLVPAGSATWPGTVTCNKGITLQGAGAGKTVITSGTGGNSAMLSISADNKRFVMSGFTLIDSSQGYAQGMVHVEGTAWRIHHINWTLHGCGIAHFGWPGGLVDHCTFNALDGGTVNPTGVQSWGDIINGNANLWSNNGVVFGTTNNFIYIEGCFFAWPTSLGGENGAVDCHDGSAMVFRYNTATNTWFGDHGCDSGGHRSTFAVEVYSNTFVNATTDARALDYAMQSRGGAGLYWGNYITGGKWNSVLKLRDYRYIQNGSSECQRTQSNCSPWGSATGSNPLDGNIGPELGYPTRDQCGFTGPTIQTPTKTVQTSSPMYIWSNTYDGSSAGGSIGSEEDCIKLNRDYFLSAKPGYTPLVYPHPLARAAQTTNVPPAPVLTVSP
jgi:hypothetical protein